METKKTFEPASNSPQGKSFLLIFSIILLLAVAAGSVYLSFARTAIVNQQAQLTQDIEALNVQTKALQGQKIEAAQSSKNYLADVEKNEIHWSEVLKSVNSLVPTSPDAKKPKVRFLSYSGSAGGKLTLNAESIPGSLVPFADLSQLVNVFNSSSYFKEAYIPSINRGVSKSGDILLSFSFNVVYSEQKSDLSSDVLTPVAPKDTSTTQVKPVTNNSPVSSSQQTTQQTTEQTMEQTKTKVPRK